MDRITATDGVVFYRSPRLASVGVPHAFSTRIGGVSAGPFDSLNLGNPNGCPVQDDRANIAANYARLHAAIDCSDRSRAFVHQVHSDTVAIARAGRPFDTDAKADAVVSDDQTRVAAVRTADCVPVLLATADGKVVAAVHAGWRGVVAGVVVRAVEAMRTVNRDGAKIQRLGTPGPSPAGTESRAGARRSQNAGLGEYAQTPASATGIVAAIGPAIGFDAFEVGPEVVIAFEAAFGGESAAWIKPSKNAGKAMIDLRAALRAQLRSLGIEAENIDVSDRCSHRDESEFFSHRRENGITGRMAALIGAA